MAKPKLNQDSKPKAPAKAVAKFKKAVTESKLAPKATTSTGKKRVVLDITPDLHERLRKYCYENNKTITATIVDALNDII